MSKLIHLFVFILSVVVCSHGEFHVVMNINPPHCTRLTKSTDYQSKFKYDYPTVYIPPGQKEAYQKLHCIKPPTVSNAVTTVCDWAAPPEVQFTLGDEFMHVIRQDPTGRFLGNAVISTQQLCNHRGMNGTVPILITEALNVE